MFSKKRNHKRANEIRTNYNFKKGRGHPAWIFEKDGQNYTFFSITHAKTTHKTKNIALIKNPNPNDNSSCYARPKPFSDKTKNFGKIHKGWKLDKRDRKKLLKKRSSGSET
ncbi:MAG: hypothetical protein WCS49_03400 [Bacilli bacterium]